MATTNTTSNYGLSQYVGSDVTSYLTNYNSDMTKIDAQMKRNADSAATANDNATIAVSTATTAASDASTALSTANTASSTATSAQTAAQEAQTAAGAAQTDAANALRASAANTIENLAPAYDPTLTYKVGDLVTYIDDQNSGKLYKCIVAIGTPEAFNVNKWDDVTTNEVYAQKSTTISTIVSDGVMTNAELMQSLMTNVDISVGKEYAIETLEAEYASIYHMSRLANSSSDKSIYCFRCDPSFNAINISTLSCGTNNIASVSRITASGVSYTDVSNDTVPAGRTFNLKILATFN